VVHDLVRRAGNISVNVIAGEELAAEPLFQRRRCARLNDRSVRSPGQI
jgi:two-component system sensor histidine kinase KdpD